MAIYATLFFVVNGCYNQGYIIQPSYWSEGCHRQDWSLSYPFTGLCRSPAQSLTETGIAVSRLMRIGLPTHPAVPQQY
jgi:hypothetical protein